MTPCTQDKYRNEQNIYINNINGKINEYNCFLYTNIFRDANILLGSVDGMLEDQEKHIIKIKSVVNEKVLKDISNYIEIL